MSSLSSSAVREPALLRIPPRPWVGLVGFLAYLAVFYSGWVIAGIQYDRIAADESTLLRWFVVPIAVGSVAVVVIVSLLGWWRPVLFERRRLSLRWSVVPGILALLAIGALLLADTSRVTPLEWLLLVIGSLLVGFNEEVMARGVLLVGLRGRFAEPAAWLLSTAAFGALHLPNWLFGEGSGAVLQAVFAFLTGTVFYLVRRSTGTVIAAVLLHAVWDFASFAGVDRSGLQGMGPGLGLLAVVLVIVLTRRESRAARALPSAA